MPNKKVLLLSQQSNSYASDAMLTNVNSLKIRVTETYEEVYGADGSYKVVEKYKPKMIPALLGIHSDGTLLAQAYTVKQLEAFDATFKAAAKRHDSVKKAHAEEAKRKEDELLKKLK